jgi:hypothetical protein
LHRQEFKIQHKAVLPTLVLIPAMVMAIIVGATEVMVVAMAIIAVGKATTIAINL